MRFYADDKNTSYKQIQTLVDDIALLNSENNFHSCAT